VKRNVRQGVEMHAGHGKSQALFLFSRGQLISHEMICSGEKTTQFEGACQYSSQGRMPGLKKLEVNPSGQASRLGQVGDLAPLCALEQLGSLGKWQENIGETYPSQFLPLRVFKCRQMLMLIVPGLRDDDASALQVG
jgi:hypothetical protein